MNGLFNKKMVEFYNNACDIYELSMLLFIEILEWRESSISVLYNVMLWTYAKRFVIVSAQNHIRDKMAILESII